MFNSVFNILIFLIPLAIFIGRIVYQAKSKNESSQIPVHFEDEEEEDDEEENHNYRDIPAASGNQGAEQINRTNDDFRPYALSRGVSEYSRGLPVPPAPPPDRTTKSQYMDIRGQAANPVPETIRRNIPQVTAGQNNFSFNLKHLSPLKQAVVMAEILGTPKGLQ